MGQKREVCVGARGETDTEGVGCCCSVVFLPAPSCVSSATAETLALILTETLLISVRGYKQFKRGLAYSTLPITPECGPLNPSEEL